MKLVNRLDMHVTSNESPKVPGMLALLLCSLCISIVECGGDETPTPRLALHRDYTQIHLVGAFAGGVSPHCSPDPSLRTEATIANHDPDQIQHPCVARSHLLKDLCSKSGPPATANGVRRINVARG